MVSSREHRKFSDHIPIGTAFATVTNAPRPPSCRRTVGGLSNDADDEISGLISSLADEDEGTQNFLDCPVIVLGDFFVVEQRVSDEGQYWQRLSDCPSALCDSLVYSWQKLGRLALYCYCSARKLFGQHERM